MQTCNWVLSSILLMVFLLYACSNKKNDYSERMAEEHANDAPIANASADPEPRLPVETQEVTYATINGKKIKGYMAKVASPDTDLPGIIVIHEWWGLNDNIRMMTRRLAGEGYVALAVDLYNGQVAESPEDARKFMQQVQQRTAISNLEQAYRFLSEQAGDEDIGVIGWCFGGGWSLQTALAMPDKIDATVIYYGRLVMDESKLKTLNMPILGIFGAEDQGIPPDQVKQFEQKLNELGKLADITIYEGANHAFANPSGTRYNKEAAEDAWQKTTRFFDENLK